MMDQSSRDRESFFSEVVSSSLDPSWLTRAGVEISGEDESSLACYRVETRREVTPEVIMAAGDRCRERFQPNGVERF